VYFVLSEQEALEIAHSARLGGRGQVIEVEIETDGLIWNAGFDANPGCTWRWPHGVVKSKHAAWPSAGLESPFTELVVRDTRRIDIVRVDDRRVYL